MAAGSEAGGPQTDKRRRRRSRAAEPDAQCGDLAVRASALGEWTPPSTDPLWHRGGPIQKATH
eukprot:8322206-Lingulodinium_polyedra.AAC.1